MLGAFRVDEDRKPHPTGLEFPGRDIPSAMGKKNLEKHFVCRYPDAFLVNLGPDGFFAYSSDVISTKLKLPGVVYGKMDGIYCIHRRRVKRSEGNQETFMDSVIKDYENMKEEAKRTDEIPYQLVEIEEIADRHRCILYDSSVNQKGASRYAYAVNYLKDEQFYYGVDSEGWCIISDSKNIMEKACGTSFEQINRSILIPLSVKSKGESSEVSSSEGLRSKNARSGEPIEGSSSDDRSPKKARPRDPMEPSSYGGSSPKKARIDESEEACPSGGAGSSSGNASGDGNTS